MVFGTNNKRLKVVWLCNFANQRTKEYFNTPDVKELAPWINILIEYFIKEPDIELHIVAPNIFNNCNSSFTLQGIHYHFYSIRPRYLPKNVMTLWRMIFGSSYKTIQATIVKIIQEIQPQIIHLHGAENPYYSSGILPLINQYPVLLTVQGFIRNSTSRSKMIENYIAIEEEIIRKTLHIAVRTDEMRDIVLSLNPKAILHFHYYPVTIPEILKNDLSSSYDIVYFARISKDKGIEDLLMALSLIKKKKKDISLHIIGFVGKVYQQHLAKLIKTLDIESNVVWVGFVETQQEIFKIAVNAKICVLPTHHDVIPGTIIECMHMKLPVIAYKVGGIPELNADQETVLLVEKQNIPQLAESIVYLLNDMEKQTDLAEKAYQLAKKKFNNNYVLADILNAYKSILKENII